MADRGTWALVGVALLVFATGLGLADIVGDDEAREVGLILDVARGHVLWPRFNQELLPDKPPLYHWLGGGLVWSLGFSELLCRLPAAICAALLVGVVTCAGRAFFGPREGLMAGVMLLTTATLASHARTARPDTLLVLLHTLAVLAAYRWWSSGSRTAATAVLVWTGVAVLAKGPVAPLLLLTTLVPFLVWNAELGRLRELLTPVGMTALLVLGLTWYVLAWWGWGSEFTEQHLVGRYLGNLLGGLADGEPYSRKSLFHHLFFYPLHLPAVLMPWAPFVLMGVWTLRRPGSLRDPRVRFLLCWMIAPVLLFTPAEYKLRYYLLPSLPPAVLFIAPLMLQLMTRRGQRLRVPPRDMLGASISALAVVGATAVVLTHPEWLSQSDQAALGAMLAIMPGGMGGLVAAVGVAAGLLAGIFACRAWPLLPPLVIAVGLAWNGIARPALERSTSNLDSLRPFARTIATHVTPDEPLAFYGPVARALVVYLDRHIPSLRRDPTRIAPGQWLLVGPRAHARLSARGLVGSPVASGSGRIQNIEHRRLILCRAPPITGD